MTQELKATIYHNPACGTSRNVLKVMQDAGYEVEVIEYLTVGWQKSQLETLFKHAGITAKEALRTSKTPAKELGLTEVGVTEEAIINAMIAEPILVNRPIVVTSKGAKMCRPSEQVLSLLDVWPKGPYFKSDGEMMIDAQGNRVDSTKS